MLLDYRIWNMFYNILKQIFSIILSEHLLSKESYNNCLQLGDEGWPMIVKLLNFIFFANILLRKCKNLDTRVLLLYRLILKL